MTARSAAKGFALAAPALGLLMAGCLVEFPHRTSEGEGAAPGPTDDALVGQGEVGPAGGRFEDGRTGTGPRPPLDASPTFSDAVGGGFEKPDGHQAGGDFGSGPDASPDAPPPPDAVAPSGVPETCDGRDEDQDGEIDESAGCGAFIQANCRAWLVWANGDGPGAVSDTWGACPGAPEDVDLFLHASSIGCNSTRPDGRFRPVPMTQDVDENDWLGVAFTCDPAAGPAATWLQAQCRIFLGQADVFGVDVQPDDAEIWATCPTTNESAPGPVQCVGSGGDGRFHAMRLFGDVDGTDRFSIAFRCEAAPGAGAAEVQRAARMTAAARVFFTYAYFYPQNGTDGWETWGDCPGADRDEAGDHRCVSSARDGRFHAVSMAGIRFNNVDFDDTFGIGLLGADD